MTIYTDHQGDRLHTDGSVISCGTELFEVTAERSNGTAVCVWLDQDQAFALAEELVAWALAHPAPELPKLDPGVWVHEDDLLELIDLADATGFYDERYSRYSTFTAHTDGQYVRLSPEGVDWLGEFVPVEAAEPVFMLNADYYDTPYSGDFPSDMLTRTPGHNPHPFVQIAPEAVAAMGEFRPTVRGVQVGDRVVPKRPQMGDRSGTVKARVHDTGDLWYVQMDFDSFYTRQIFAESELCPLADI